MARLKKIAQLNIEEHTLKVNEIFIDKYNFELRKPEYWGWGDEYLKVIAVCKKCSWETGKAIRIDNLEIDEKSENIMHLRLHYYQYHKSRRNENRQEINNVALMHSYEIAKGSDIAKSENNDCVVRAFAAVFEMSYDESHALLKRHGRKDRSGTPWITSDTAMAEIVSKGSFKAIRRNDLEANKWTNNYRRTGMTLNGLIPRLNPSRRYLICSRAHMFAYVSGRLVDWKKGGKRTIVRVWEIEKFP